VAAVEAMEAMEDELPLYSDDPLEEVVDTDVLRRFPRVCVFVVEKDVGSCMMNCRGGRVSSFCCLDAEALLVKSGKRHPDLVGTYIGSSLGRFNAFLEELFCLE